ncbi:MAG: HPF/RaiA family ribosome-associated protein [Candidatus Peribacteraceae bacterium]|jgi:ribosomal subunit interface protein
MKPTPGHGITVEHVERGIQLTDRDLLFFAKKIGRLGTYCRRLKDEASVIRVETERRPTKKDRDQVKVMITITLPGKLLRAESRRVSPLDAVDRCIEKLEPQIKRYKDLHTGKGLASANLSR